MSNGTGLVLARGIAALGKTPVKSILTPLYAGSPPVKEITLIGKRAGAQNNA
jgi:hypothetical protein